MNVEYVPYKEEYYNDLKHITLSSFQLTSFNTDRRIISAKAGEIAWGIWCRPVLESDKNQYCIVALVQNKAVGYIIYGADVELSKVLNKKIGTIILIAIDKKFQGQYRIASHLLKYVIDIYHQYKIDIITAGTDLDNLPALINYINSGFKPILFWSTFRYYFENRIKEDKNITIEKIYKISRHDVRHYSRPVSLLLDNRIDKSMRKKLNSYIQKSIISSIKKKAEVYSVRDKSKNRAVFILIKEPKHSEILGKTLFRINDIIFYQENVIANCRLLNQFMHYLKREIENVSIIEVFIESNNWKMIEILNKAGMLLVHNAVTLHKFF